MILRRSSAAIFNCWVPGSSVVSIKWGRTSSWFCWLSCCSYYSYQADKRERDTKPSQHWQPEPGLTVLSCRLLGSEFRTKIIIVFYFQVTSWHTHWLSDIKQYLYYRPEITMADTGVEAAEAVGESTENIPEIELIIKASTIDGRRKGACLFCQVRLSSI